MTHTFQISLFRHKRDNAAMLVDRTWDQLCDNFRKPVVRLEKDGPLFSPAVFSPPIRSKRNAKQLSLLVFDVDHNADLESIKAKTSVMNCALLIASTHSHLRQTESNPDAEPRFRVVLPLEVPIPAERFPALWQYVKRGTALPIDEAAKDASRIFYTPVIAYSDSPYECHIFEGPMLDWRKLQLEDAHPSFLANRNSSFQLPANASTRIANGSRNHSLFKIGKKLARSGISPEAIKAMLKAENARACIPPLPVTEVESIASNVLIYPIEVSDNSETEPPIPLPQNEVEVPELNEMLLPEPWRPWLSDVSERLQCPPDYAAVSALIAAASLIGNRIRVRPKQHDSWMVVPNLWGAIVGPPGVMKTPAVREGLLFFQEIADRERAEFERDQRDAEFEKEFNESRKAELIKEMKKASIDKKADLRMRFENLKAEEPVEKRLWTTDATVEKLGEILNENPQGLLVLRDELTGWLKSLDRHGHEQDRAFYLEAWNGEGSFTFDRIGRGKTHIKNLTISLLGTIQPSMIEPYYRSAMNGLGDDGLIQRFQLLVYPEIVKRYKYIDRPPAGRDTARNSFNLLYEFNPKDVGAKYLTADAGGYAFLQFDSEAQERFQTWLTELETELRSGTIENAALESHIAKYRSLMPSLALIFHLLDRVTSATSAPSISSESVSLASAWCSYLQKHAEKLYTLVSLSEFDCAKEILKRIRSGEIAGEFTARDIYGNHWKKLSNPEDVKRGLELLTEYRYLTSTKLETGGRGKTIYTCHQSIGSK